MASLYDSASLVMIPSGYKEDKVYSIKPTDGSGDLAFSRSLDTATRVNSSGLIEKVRTNLLTYSEDFTQNWVLIGGGSITANTTTAPDGTLTADTWTQGGYVRRDFTFSAIPYTYTLYVKATSGTSTGRIYFLNSGDTAISQVSYTANATEWQRISVTIQDAVASGIVRIGFGIDTGTTSLYVWGAQLETGDIATDYIATTSAAVSVGPVANLPRLDYSGGASCPKLLLEGQRTNALNFSESFDNAYWPKADVSVTANAAVSPDGYTNADKLIADATNANHLINKAGGLPVTSGQAYTFSLFAKAAEYNFVRVQIQASTFNQSWANFNLSNGTLGLTSGGITTKIENYGNGWYRCSVTSTATSTGNSGVQPFVLDSDRGTDSPSYLGNGTSGILIYGAQFETGAYATSYIPTLSAASTRGIDTAITASIPSTIGQTEGTLYVEYTRNSLAESFFVILSLLTGTTAGSYANSIYFYQLENSTLVVEGYVSNSQQFAFSKSGGVSVGTHKIALAYKLNDFALYIDGVQIGTDTSGNLPTMNYLTIGGGADVFGASQSINQSLLFPTRLTNAELAALTTI